MVERTAAATADDPSRSVTQAIVDLLARVPHTREHEGVDPAERAQQLAQSAARRASVTAGTLALPVGPIGWLTILPELVAIWRIQAQMVADIAGAYGKHASLTREHMLYCMFRYAAAQAVRDLVVRMGQRVLVRRLPIGAVEGIAARLATRITRRVVGEGISRWLPLIGAMGVGAYAWYDTKRVAEAAIGIFESEIVVEPVAELGPGRTESPPASA
jgi:hypothetical protein